MATDPKPERMFRVDRGQLRAPRVTAEGFLEVEGYIARPGIYEYVNTPADEKRGLGKAGTIRRELKPREEVIAPKLLGQLAALTITAEHPPGHRVTAENRSAVDVGAVRDGRVDGDMPVARLVIKDKKTVSRVQRGELNELSPGFEAMIHRTPGADRSYATPTNPEGRYDLVQRDIEVNHLALTDFARGGADLRLRLDAVGSEFAGIEGRADGFDGRLTDAVDGHQHLVSFCGWDGAHLSSGDTSWAVSDGSENGHSHPWIKNIDGTVTIGASAGHTHAVLDERRYRSPEPATVMIGARTDARFAAHMLDIKHMAPDEQIRFLLAKHDELAAANADLATKNASLTSDLAAKSTRVDALEQSERTQVERIETLRAQIASGAVVAETEALKQLQTRVDSAEVELAKIRAEQPALVKKRAELIVKARTVLGPEFRTDSLEDRAIQEHLIRKLRPTENLGALNPAQVEARCDSLYADAQTAAIERARPIVDMREMRVDSAPVDDNKLSWRDQWKRGLNPAR